MSKIHHIHYYLRARHRKGHGVHSPFVYQLITGIIEEDYPYYCYEELEKKRSELLCPNRCRSMSPRYAQVLFRLINALGYRNIMEWGESDPITRLYLQRVSRLLKLHSGGSERTIVPDLLICYFESDAGKLSAALEQALSHKAEHSLLVLTGLHRSEGVNRCWKQVIAHPDVSLSVEMSGLGLVFFRPELQKRNYILRH